jgi:hypothetical protein
VSSQSDDTPQTIDSDFIPPVSKGSGNRDKLIMLVLSVVVSFAMCFVYTGVISPFVAKSDFDTNIKNMSKFDEDLSSRISSLENSQTQKTVDLSKYALKSELTDKISELGSQYARASDLKAIQDSIKSMQGSMGGTSSATPSSDAATIKAIQDQIKVLNETVGTNGKQIDELQTQVKKLETDISTISTTAPATTPTATPGSLSTLSTSTYGVIKASIQANSVSWNNSSILTTSVQPPSYGTVTNMQITNGGSGYTSVPSITIAAPSTSGSITATAQAVLSGGSVTGLIITNGGNGYTSAPAVTIDAPPAGGTQATASVVSFIPMQAYSTTSSFQINISNTHATYTAQNVQLAIGLAVVDSNGNPVGTTPNWITPGTNLTVSSSIFGLAWNHQNIVSPSTYVFVSQSGSSIFGQGITMQPKQESIINMTVTLTNTNYGNYSNVYFMPLIKVVGYQT